MKIITLIVLLVPVFCDTGLIDGGNRFVMGPYQCQRKGVTNHLNLKCENGTVDFITISSSNNSCDDTAAPIQDLSRFALVTYEGVMHGILPEDSPVCFIFVNTNSSASVWIDYTFASDCQENSASNLTKSIILGIVLSVVGLVIIYYLIQYAKKHRIGG